MVELFPKNATVGIFSIPLLVVISFEVTKVFIIFLNKQYSDSKNEKYIIAKTFFLNLRGLLIAISGIFTLLYTFYNLNNPELEKRLSQKKEEINSVLEQQKENINENYDRQSISINSNYDNQIEPYKNEMKAQENFRYSNGEFKGPEWNAANENVQKLNDARNSALAKNETNRTEVLNQLAIQSITSINDAEKELKTDNSSSNKMVNATLEVITFNPNYGKGYYIFAIFILSVLISFGLEFVIWGSFTVLAINHGKFFELDLELHTIGETHKAASETVDKMNNTELKSEKNWFIKLKDNIIRQATVARDNGKNGIKKIFNNGE